MATPADLPAIAVRVAAVTASGDDERDRELAELAVEACNAYAPAAPVSAVREAAVRMAGWLRDVSPGHEAVTLDGDAVQHRMSHGSALRNSGAQALLSVYRVRRAPGGF